MAEECALGLCLKYLPGETRAGVRREFEEYVAAVAATDPWLRDHPPEIEWGIGGASFPPSEIALDHPLAIDRGNAYRAALGEPEWRGFEAVSDLAWLAEGGIPGLLYGPGDATQAHTTAEYVAIDDLVAATNVVALAVAELVRPGLSALVSPGPPSPAGRSSPPTRRSRSRWPSTCTCRGSRHATRRLARCSR